MRIMLHSFHCQAPPVPWAGSDTKPFTQDSGPRLMVALHTRLGGCAEMYASTLPLCQLRGTGLAAGLAAAGLAEPPVPDVAAALLGKKRMWPVSCRCATLQPRSGGGVHVNESAITYRAPWQGMARQRA